MNSPTTNNTPDRAGLLQELIRNASLAWRLLVDSRVPLLAKLLPAGVLLYVLSPVDLVPDVIPLFGQLDDLLAIVLGVRAFIALCPPELVRFYQSGAHGYAPPDDSHDDKTVDGTFRVMDDR
ncbi:MAG: DUF1232 domain-containing protein [Chloroflexi bacterium]|nr:DUF1232 domain-containing protein [Chloroflexota bacterium]